MSKYTTQLRFPIEQKLSNLGYNQKESNWKYTYEMLGLKDYPIFNEAYRETLNNKIIRSYYFREIGFETLGQFSWQMRRTMFEIMPYYNQLYESQDLVTDPMYSTNMDYSETWTRDEKITDTTNTDETRKEERNETQSKTTDEEQVTTGLKDTTSENTVGTGNTRTVSETTSNKKVEDEDTSNVRTDNLTSTSHTTLKETTVTTDDARNIFEDTPMNALDSGAVENYNYATNITYDHDDNNSYHDSTTDNKTTNTGTVTDKGTDDKTTTDSGSRNETIKDSGNTSGASQGTEKTNGTMSDRINERMDDSIDISITDNTDTNKKEIGDYDGTKKHNQKGYDKSQSELLLTYRETFINIDLEIIERLNILFMGVW